MKISTNNYFLIKKKGEFESVRILKEAGFDYIDFSFDAYTWTELLDEENFTKKIQEVKKYANQMGITFNQAHAPFGSSVGNEEKDEKIFQAIVNSIKYASILGAEIIVVHPKQHLEYKYNVELLKQMNDEFYKRLIPYCEKYKVKVAVENMWRYQPISDRVIESTCARPEEFVDYVDSANSPWIVACLDVGHAALVDQDIAPFIKTLSAKRLKALHIHDVDYINDNHTLPGFGKINFEPVVKALKEIGYEGVFTLECSSFFNHFNRDYDIDFLPTAAKFMADRTKYLIETIK